MTKDKVQEIGVLNTSHKELEATVAEAYQHVMESIIELDAVAKVKKLGAVIEQIPSKTSILDALIHPSIPPEQIFA